MQQLPCLVLLAFVTAILYVLPFIPALIEWMTKADSNPAHVNFQDRTIVDYCIRMFNDDIDDQFGSLLDDYQQLTIDQHGVHVDGSEYYITGKTGPLVLSDKETISKKTNKIVLICQQAILPDNMTFENKVYARKGLITGVNSTFNEVVSAGSMLVKSGVVINKLMFSGASTTFDEGCTLNGYTRAQNKLHFLGRAKFNYLYAPIIEFGHIKFDAPIKAIDIFLEDIPRIITQKDLVIPMGTQQKNHIVAKASLVIKPGCKITGNIKSYHDVIIENDNAIIGAIFSEKDISISSGCYIQGPIVAKGTLRIGDNCIIGAKDDMTSLVAQTIIISGNCRVFGLILAKLNGVSQNE